MSRWHWDSSPLVGHRALGRSGAEMSVEDDVINHILGSWRPASMVPQPPALVKPGMRCEASRLRTFSVWPGPSTLCPHELARAGFFYLGPGDRVQCFCCGGVLRCWEPGDEPLAEHHKFFPSCPFVMGREVGNISRVEGRDSVDGQILGQLQRLPGEEEEEETWQAVYTDMVEERERLVTYRNWPQYAEVTPDQLARAGFFYTGHRDNVKCFHCDGGLRNWERGDDPWREHAKWFPRCEFLIQSMGPAYIRSVQDTLFSSPESTPESRRSSDMSSPIDSISDCQAFLQSSIAQGALQMGFDEKLVASLVQSRFLLVGAPYNSVSDLVHDLVQAEEERTAYTTEPVRTPEAPVQRASLEPQPQKEPESALSTEEQLRRLKEERMCKVCMDKDVSMVFVPCGHLVVCKDCAPNLRHCPICRATIRGSVRAFMS